MPRLSIGLLTILGMVCASVSQICRSQFYDPLQCFIGFPRGTSKCNIPRSKRLSTTGTRIARLQAKKQHILVSR